MHLEYVVHSHSDVIEKAYFANVNIDITDVNIMILRYQYLNEKTMFSGWSDGRSHFGSCSHDGSCHQGVFQREEIVFC